jgi:hypothetical protein
MVSTGRTAELESQAVRELIPIGVTWVLALVGGVYLLRGHGWARWLLVAWAGFHVFVSLFHEPLELALHALVLALVAYFLFRGSTSRFFQTAQLLIFGAFVACAPARVDPTVAGPSAHAFAVRQIPTRVGEFRQLDVHRFPQRELGTAYRYSDDSPLRPDVYVYPLIVRDEGMNALALAQAEAALLPQGLEMQRARGRFSSFQIVADSVIVVSVPGGSVPGSHIAGVLFRGDTPRETHQHLFALGDQFVKVRTSYAPGEVELGRLEEFIADLLRLMLASAQQAA